MYIFLKLTNAFKPFYLCLNGFCHRRVKPVKALVRCIFVCLSPNAYGRMCHSLKVVCICARMYACIHACIRFRHRDTHTMPDAQDVNACIPTVCALVHLRHRQADTYNSSCSTLCYIYIRSLYTCEADGTPFR